jgi:hypothetical protein
MEVLRNTVLEHSLDWQILLHVLLLNSVYFHMISTGRTYLNRFVKLIPKSQNASQNFINLPKSIKLFSVEVTRLMCYKFY